MITLMRRRRTILSTPGSSEKMLRRSAQLGMDSAMLDLEDGVAPSEKERARKLVCWAIRELDFGAKERMARINRFRSEWFEGDILEVAEVVPDVVVLPKVEAEEEVRRVDVQLSEIEQRIGISAGSIKLMPMTETAKGILNARGIAHSSKRITAMTFGTVDLVRDTGASFGDDTFQLFWSYPVTLISLICSELSIDKIWSVYPKIGDLEGLKRFAQLGAKLGYDGMIILHPDNIEPINSIFTPSEEEVERATRIVMAFNEAMARGLGAVSLDGMLLELPVVEAAKRVLAKAGIKEIKT